MSDLPQQNLPETWAQFEESLSQIWDELGMEGGVRSMHLNDVLRQVSEVLNDRVRQEKNVRDSTRRSIQTSASKIVLLSKQLGLEEISAHEFIADHTGSHVSLFQSRDTLSRELERLMADRSQLMNELIDVLGHLFSMEADLGESTGALELFSELQSQSYDDTQANTFRNDPSSLDHDTLVEIPQTVEKLRQLMVNARALCETRTRTLIELDESIESLCVDVGENRQAYRNASLSQHPELSLRRIEAVKAIEAQLVALRDRRGHILHDFANKLRVVWDQLGVPTEERSAFIKRNEGRSMEVIRACEEELRRVTALKTVRVRELVLKLRQKIRAAWDTLSVPQIERKLFEDRYDYDSETNFSDETLEVHKTLANNLEELVVLSEPLLDKIKEYEALLEDKEKYDILTQNGDRLRDRKYSMTAELALSRKVAQIPRCNEILIFELTKWKTQNRNQPLLYNGVDFLQRLLDENQRLEMEKGSKRRKPSPTLNASSSGASSSSSNFAAASSSNSAAPSAAPSQNLPSATPGRGRSASSRTNTAAPATTGKPVASRSRTNTADGTKSIAAKAHPKENSANK
jgi:hypothetical protein